MSADDPPPHLPAQAPHFTAGDARNLAHLPEASVDVIVTSPPYWKRRDYGHERQFGQEDTPETYVAALLTILAGWMRVLKPHSSIFLNLGDSYDGGFLVGVPALFEVEARRLGWNVLNHIVWSKSIGMPEAKHYRLASRHEPIYQLTRARHATDVFMDLFALGQHLQKSANPGDVWLTESGLVSYVQDLHSGLVDHVWDLHPARSKSGHLAPFPPELAERAILLACPERVCTACGKPHLRQLGPTADLDTNRKQAKRALEKFAEARLTEEHLVAIRAVGISDAGKGKLLQDGSGKNSERIRALAQEAKAALGGYFREFTFAPKRQVGWETCGCNAPTQPGVVLDPFMGSGTTLKAAQSLGRNAIGVDLVPPESLGSGK